jgi:hypothetical protein
MQIILVFSLIGAVVLLVWIGKKAALARKLYRNGEKAPALRVAAMIFGALGLLALVSAGGYWTPLEFAVSVVGAYGAIAGLVNALLPHKHFNARPSRSDEEYFAENAEDDTSTHPIYAGFSAGNLWDDVRYDD